jgi:hypothetical protein
LLSNRLPNRWFPTKLPIRKPRLPPNLQIELPGHGIQALVLELEEVELEQVHWAQFPGTIYVMLQYYIPIRALHWEEKTLSSVSVFVRLTVPS